MSKPPQENDLLLPFEQHVLPPEYKEYYRTKRNNFFATIQKLPELWNYYIMLDQIWYREIDLLKPAAPNRAFPILLFINAHAKVRIAIELAFAGCIAEARSIMRDGVEFVAHAHHVAKDPALQEVWLSKNDDEKAYKAEFWNSKETGLFNGLDELYEAWCRLSEVGAHANINSVCERFRSVEKDGNLEFSITYTGGMDEHRWAVSIFDLLLIFFKMEETFYKDYHDRLQFDETLVKMRAQFEVYKEKLRQLIITRYKISPPSVIRP